LPPRQLPPRATATSDNRYQNQLPPRTMATKEPAKQGMLSFLPSLPLELFELHKDAVHKKSLFIFLPL